MLSLDLCSSRFEALSHPSRLRILQLAKKAGTVYNAQLARDLDQDATVVSHHLKTLYDAGFLVKVKSGKFTIYRLAQGVLTELSTELSTLETT